MLSSRDGFHAGQIGSHFHISLVRVRDISEDETRGIGDKFTDEREMTCSLSRWERCLDLFADKMSRYTHTHVHTRVMSALDHAVRQYSRVFLVSVFTDSLLLALFFLRLHSSLLGVVGCYRLSFNVIAQSH